MERRQDEVISQKKHTDLIGSRNKTRVEKSILKKSLTNKKIIKKQTKLERFEKLNKIILSKL